MEITIKIPKSVIEFCNKKNIKSELIPKLYKEYIDCINNDNAHADSPFFNWFEEDEGQDAIDELNRENEL